MIYEYAIEPELVATWHEQHLSNFYLWKFGGDSGRVVSQYPLNWEKLVWNAYNGPPVAKMRLTDLMKQMKSPFVDHRKDNWVQTKSWLENAEIEHLRLPFHAILASENPRNKRIVIRGDRLIKNTPKKIDAPSTKTIKKDVASILKAVRPVIRCASHILLVDQYFDPKKSRFVKVFNALIGEIKKIGSNKIIELHICDKNVNSVDSKAYKKIEKAYEEIIKSKIPKNIKFTVFVWNIKSGGDAFHNRFILTNVGGIMVPYGLDEHEPRSIDEHKSGAKDDIVRLSAESFKIRWNEFTDPDEFVYKKIGEIKLR